MDVCQKMRISFNICPSLRVTKEGHHCLGMPSTKGTYSNNRSDSIIDIVNKFNLEKKMVGFTCDGGGNIKKCSDIIFHSWIT